MVLPQKETYAKILVETGSRTSQYKKLGKVKMENQAAVAAVFLLMLLFIGGDKQKHFLF